MSLNSVNLNYKTPRWLRIAAAVSRYNVLILSVILIVWITRDTLEGITMGSSPEYMRFQLCVCLYFLFDIALETFGAARGRRLHWLLSHWLFVLVSIPWLTLFEWTGVRLPEAVGYVIKFVPMIRTGYVVAIITGALSSDKAVTLMETYVMWVIASVYFGSLMFYVEESPINPQVDSWATSLWWASVNMTTLGCSVHPITVTGRIIAMVLSCEGVMLLPVFTVYVTSAVRAREKRGPLTLDSYRRAPSGPQESQNTTSSSGSSHSTE